MDSSHSVMLLLAEYELENGSGGDI
jgi:hypothetical protein